MSDYTLIIPKWALEEGIKEGIIYKKENDYYWEGFRLIIRE